MDLCGFKKDRFYIYQSRWRPELPIAHILPHWNWPTRIGEVTPVHVYTSGDEAELFLNGQSLGRKKKMPFEYRLRWDDVRYAPGELYVVAYKNGVQWATDTMRTTGPSIALTLKVDRSHITSDGNDLAFVTVTAVDACGEKVPTESREVRFDVSGSGVIAAVANGDPTSHESFQSTHIPLFHGQCLVIIRSQEGSTGSIRLLAETESLKSGELFLTAD